MSVDQAPVRGDIHNPADVENKIEETKNRIAAGVKIVTAAEREMKARRRDFDLAWAYAIKKAEGPEYLRKSEAAITTMPHREEAENAELAFKHATRTADALERELFAWQSILNSVRAMYNAAGVR
jgi:collagenase-like PrtC family protease